MKEKRYALFSQRPREQVMETAIGVRDWVLAQAPGTYFTSADVPGAPGRVAVTLSRLAVPEGPIVRARQGIYWRKGPMTRFGVGAPDPLRVALLAAGAGSGPAGASAANLLGLSTQVPSRPHVAVIGRAPKGLKEVRITTRSNAHRITLTPIGVAILEVLRDPDRVSELRWPQLRDRIIRRADEERIDLRVLAAVARRERPAALHERLDALLPV